MVNSWSISQHKYEVQFTCYKSKFERMEMKIFGNDILMYEK